MSGHSHWARIKRKKGATDAKRGKMFSKLAKNIMTAARLGGGDPSANLRLKYAIEKAKEANMPRDNIERAIKKGTGEIEGETLDQLTYEAFVSGVAFLIEVLTDNRNRTASEVRKIIETRGGNMTPPGAASRLFSKKGLFLVDANAADEDTVMEAALEAGAEDMKRDNSTYEITCAPQDFDSVKKALQEQNIPVESGEISQVPNTYVDVDEEAAKKLLDLMEALEDHDDVQNVYANFNIPEKVMQEIQAG